MRRKNAGRPRELDQRQKKSKTKDASIELLGGLAGCCSRRSPCATPGKLQLNKTRRTRNVPDFLILDHLACTHPPSYSFVRADSLARRTDNQSTMATALSRTDWSKLIRTRVWPFVKNTPGSSNKPKGAATVRGLQAEAFFRGLLTDAGVDHVQSKYPKSTTRIRRRVFF